ncbi:ribosome maturation factor RimP [Isoptericola dokdonensis]|jgi:ribosome maturation factor RimP|uniref:Ribosome maturation factor RimP n=1 Tax=Isoptericola dokdonensis DS-3 TaxID=1300344 RepID=A0A161IK24_9MICO|nr:ribosome assembly cofactor RimP [Isoptericola dokdonensis]ANC30620.1 Ribosome maturation factor RimP [Isoptericola dokdonensis DS-3]
MAAGRSQAADERVRAVVAPAVDAAGLYLEDVRLVRTGSTTVVRVTVDLDEDVVGSLDSDTLGEVSKAVSSALDDTDAVAGAYTLEVSTPGATRPLTEPRHFRRARTRLVKLVLDDGSTAEGRLVDVVDTADGPAAVLEDGPQVPVSRVRKGKVEVELRRLEDEADDTADGEEG